MTKLQALILTILCPHTGPPIAQQLVGEIVSQIPRPHRSTPRWLAEGHSCEIELFARDGDGTGPWLTKSELIDAVRFKVLSVAHNVGLVDLAFTANAPRRRKRLLIADMESTIIAQEMLDELADFVGLRGEISAITERAMRGELDFEAALKERVGLLKGLDVNVLDKVTARITLMPGAETLIRTMKANGAYCALVSGGFTVFTQRIANQLGFDEHQANVLEIADGKLTGRVLAPILGREAKLEALRRLTARLGIDPAETLAVGDGANDLAMLQAAGLGVAFRAKPKVGEAVAALPNGAVIDHGDLTALLYLQGYRRQDFAVA